MAAKEKAADKGSEKKPAKSGGKGHPFLWGIVLGLIIGIFTGWMVQPPESFHIDRVRKNTGDGLVKAKDASREKLADGAESLAKQLRK